MIPVSIKGVVQRKNHHVTDSMKGLKDGYIVIGDRRVR
jgi:hypothetical protein